MYSHRPNTFKEFEINKINKYICIYKLFSQVKVKSICKLFSIRVCVYSFQMYTGTNQNEDEKFFYVRERKFKFP